MKKGTKWLIAGVLGIAFAYATAVWALYPDNREDITDFGRNMGILEPLPPPPAQRPVYVTAGFKQAPKSEYMPPVAAQGCNADDQLVRLNYEISFVEDEKRDEILNHPRIAGDNEKYMSLRRSDVTEIIQKQWQAESAKIAQNPGSLQKWLKSRADEIYQTHGLKVSFRVNIENGLDITEPRTNTLNACSPAGFVPPPLKNSGSSGTSPQPF